MNYVKAFFIIMYCICVGFFAYGIIYYFVVTWPVYTFVTIVTLLLALLVKGVGDAL